MIDKLGFPSLSEQPRCLSRPVSSQNSHFTFQRDLFNFVFCWISSDVKCRKGNFCTALPFSHRLSKNQKGQKKKFLNKLAFECYVKFLLCCLCAWNRVLSRCPCPAFTGAATTPPVWGSRSSQMREFSASVEHVGGDSYCIFILSLWLCFRLKEGQLAAGIRAAARTTSNISKKVFNNPSLVMILFGEPLHSAAHHSYCHGCAFTALLHGDKHCVY